MGEGPFCCSGVTLSLRAIGGTPLQLHTTLNVDLRRGQDGRYLPPLQVFFN